MRVEQGSSFPPYVKVDVGQHVAALRTGLLFRSAWGLEPGLPGAVDDPTWKVDMRGRTYVTPEELALDHSRIAVIPVEQPRTAAVLAAHATRADYAANYIGMLDHCGGALAQVVAAVADGVEDGGCVVGCSIGRDRTGVVLALIQRGLGVPAADVLEAERRMRGEVAALVARSPHTFNGMTREEVLTRLGAAHEPVVDSLEDCERRWGSVRGHLAEHGLSPEVWTRLERALLA